MAGMGKLVGSSEPSVTDPVISTVPVCNTAQLSSFWEILQGRISRRCLALAIDCSVVSQLDSSLKKEEEAGWLGGRMGEGRSRQQDSPILQVVLAAEMEEEVF